MGAGETDNGRKCERSMWFCESMENEPKDCLVWWKDEINAAVRGKEVLAASDEEAKERCMKMYREKEG